MNAEIRFYGNPKELDSIKKAMDLLLFHAGKPYHYPSGGPCYLPYHGKKQVIKFMQKVKPRKQNDISKLIQ